MDYRLEGLDPRSFEQLIQALALREIGPGVVIFGDGPDGGREASFRGAIPNMGSGDWEGHLVVQAKFRKRSGSGDGKWARDQLRKELSVYERNLRRRPTHYLFATNVGLSAVADSGWKDTLSFDLDSAVASGWLRDYDIWDRDKLCRLLDAHADVRRAYAAWITPGDVLAAMYESLELAAPDFDRTVSLFLQKELLADQYANLEQAGRPAEDRIPIARVFVDLPLASEDDAGGRGQGDPRFVELLLRAAHMKLDAASLDSDARWGRWVLVGGPGQGKTTLGQHICQLFRAALLRDRPPETLALEARRTIELLSTQCEGTPISLPTARRFPLRVVLNEFATELDQSGGKLSLLRFVLDHIERRIDRTVPMDVFRSWLAGYPWLIVLDGLDEVPNSSNRQEMLRAIDEFWVDLAESQTDVLVLATTRPQGYNDDFAPALYRHHQLAPLAPDEALGYARQLVSARYGATTDRERWIMRRLERASKVEATARLMQSPLQVTIMATLVDQIGEPPDQRWSLFSEYYDVIYKREVERGIAAARVLRSHKPNVDSIHRRVALVLQIESEMASNTEAHLSHDRLAAIVETRLREEQHDGRELDELRDDILAAATERLVFVVGLERDKIGFEIRSLQEFMAAEALMDGSDELVQARLRAIAQSSAWRNVFLFAAGRCFEVRQHLRDTIHTICAELNDAIDDPVARTARAGALLAIDLLDDGLAREQPLYRKLLLNQALRVVQRPAANAHDRLARLYAERDREEFERALRDALTGSSQGSGSWRILRRLIEHRVAWAEDLLIDLWPTSMEAERALIDELAGVELGDHLAARLREAVPRHDLIGDDVYAKLLKQLAASASPTKALLLSAARRSGSFRVLVLTPAIDPDSTLQLIVGSAAGRAPESPIELPGGDIARHWRTEAAALNFLRDPTAARLADAVEDIARVGSVSRRSSMPWPLLACLDWVAEHGDAERLVEALRSGELGDGKVWRDAEERWQADGITRKDIEHGSPNRLPFDRDIGRIGFPLSVGGWRFADLRRASKVLETWLTFAPSAFERRTIARRLLGFAAWGTYDRKGLPTGMRVGQDEFARLVDEADFPYGPHRHSWEEGFDVMLISFLDADWDADNEELVRALDAYGLQGPSARPPKQQLSMALERLAALIDKHPESAGIWRLAAATAVGNGGRAAPSQVPELTDGLLERAREVAPEAAVLLALALRDCAVPSAEEVVASISREPAWAPLLSAALVTAGWHIEDQARVAELDEIGAHLGYDRVLSLRPAATVSVRSSELQSEERRRELGLIPLPALTA